MKTTIKLKEYLSNPFRMIAGTKSLIYSIILMFLLSFLGFWSNTYFDGVLDVHFGCSTNIVPYKIHLWYQFSTFFSMTLFFYLASVIMSKTRGRLVDIAGALSLARFPLIFIALLGFIPSIHICIDNISASKLITLFQNYNMLYLILIGIVSLLFIIWMIILMFNAFNVSSYLKGLKGGLTFTKALILAEVLSKVLNHYVIPLL